VDKVYWFIAPMLIGGEGAPGAIGGKGIEKLQQALRLQRTTTHHFGEDICIEGYVK
jgi:diaminohydroxyphosphoribosylaminopyrimidine deaminase/5-amino-6-(5-phosphoribosylamino)uracil reductase